jgi:polyphosphate kinase
VFEQKYIDREKSWLAFNSRVLQEAADDTVPLLDRLRFLGIFSNNLDEFFRVRFAAIRRLSLSGITGEKYFGGVSSQQLIKDITAIVIQQQSESLRILSNIEEKLEKEKIYITHGNDINAEQEVFLKEFFIQKLSPELVTIILNDLAEFPILKDSMGYLAVKLVMIKNQEVRYAIIEIPKMVNRFVVLPPINDKQYVILIDDVIRMNLSSIFNIFSYEIV